MFGLFTFFSDKGNPEHLVTLACGAADPCDTNLGDACVGVWTFQKRASGNAHVGFAWGGGNPCLLTSVGAVPIVPNRSGEDHSA